MDCKFIHQNELHEKYVLNKLVDSERSKFEIHLQKCPDCQQKLEIQKLLIEGIRQAGRQELKAEIQRQVADHNKTTMILKPETRRLNWMLLSKIAAVLLILVIPPSIYLYNRYNIDLQQRSLASKMTSPPVFESGKTALPHNKKEQMVADNSTQEVAVISEEKIVEQVELTIDPMSESEIISETIVEADVVPPDLKSDTLLAELIDSVDFSPNEIIIEDDSFAFYDTKDSQIVIRTDIPDHQFTDFEFRQSNPDKRISNTPLNLTKEFASNNRMKSTKSIELDEDINHQFRQHSSEKFAMNSDGDSNFPTTLEAGAIQYFDSKEISPKVVYQYSKSKTLTDKNYLIDEVSKIRSEKYLFEAPNQKRIFVNIFGKQQNIEKDAKSGLPLNFNVEIRVENGDELTMEWQVNDEFLKIDPQQIVLEKTNEKLLEVIIQNQYRYKIDLVAENPKAVLVRDR